MSKNDILDEALLSCAEGCHAVFDMIQRDDGKPVKFVIYVWPEGEPGKGRMITPGDISDDELRKAFEQAVRKVGEDVRYSTGEADETEDEHSQDPVDPGTGDR